MQRSRLLNWLSITYVLATLYIVTAFHYLRLFERSALPAILLVIVLAAGLSAMTQSRRSGVLFVVLGVMTTVLILVVNLVT